MNYNSVILRLTSISVKKVNDYFSGSLILGIIFSFFSFLYKAYMNSFFVGLFESASAYTRKYFNGSIIWSFIKKENRVSKVWEDSFFYKCIDFILNLPFGLINFLGMRFYKFLKDSKIFAILSRIIKRIDILLAITLVGIIIVPDKLWYNAYSLCLAVLMILIFIVNVAFIKDQKFKLRAIDFPLILFGAMTFLMTFISFSPGSSARFLVFQITCFVFVLLIVSVFRSGKSLGTLLNIFLFGVSFIGLYGVWQSLTNSVPFDPSLSDLNLNGGMPGRVFSTMGNPNNFAEVLVLTLPLFGAVIMNARSNAKRILFSLLSLPPLASLFFTGSRSSWVAFTIAIFVFVFLKNKKLIPLIIVAGIVAIPFLPDYIQRRFLTIFNSNDSSANYRKQIFDTVFPMLKDYWVRGIGLGTDVFMNIVSKYYQFTSKTPVHTHILYLQIWIEMGITGIMTFAWFMTRLLKNSLIKIYNNSENNLNNILIAGVSSISGILFIGCVEYVWYYPRVMLVFWMVVGIMMAALGIAADREKKCM